MTDDAIKGLIRAYASDLQAFSAAKAALRYRAEELEGNPHYDEFVTWAGTQAALNVLIMCESRCRGLIEDLQNNIKSNGTVVRLVQKETDS